MCPLLIPPSQPVRGNPAEPRGNPGKPQGISTEAPGILRLVLWKFDVARLLGVTVRSVDRMISAGDMPSPEIHIRGRRAWKAKTIQEWVDAGCPRHPCGGGQEGYPEGLERGVAG